MSNYDILNEMEADGRLKQLVVSGIMPVKVITHLDVYRSVDVMTKTGMTKTNAVCETAENFKLCRSSVFKIIRAMR